MGKRADLTVTDTTNTSTETDVANTPLAAWTKPEEKADAKARDKKDDVAAIREGIEQTRNEMSRTVGAIEERLSPAHLKEQLADVKDSFIAQYHDAKDHIKEDIASEVRDAKEKVKEELSDAKHMVEEQIGHAKDAVRDATIGKVKELASDAKHLATDLAVDAKHLATDLAVDAKHLAVDAGHGLSNAGASVLTTIRRNPIPTAMVAVGVGWLAMNLLKRRSAPRLAAGRHRPMANRVAMYDNVYTERNQPHGLLAQGQQAASDAMHKVGARAADLGHRVGETASSIGHRVEETASTIGRKVGSQAQQVLDQAERVAHDTGARVTDLGHRAQAGASSLVEGAEHLAHDARDQAAHLAHEAREQGMRVVHGAEHQFHRAEETVEETYTANPLAFGAISLAVGAAIGLALPHTAREDAWMGETKDRLLQGAGHLAHDAIHKVQEQASALTHMGHTDATASTPA